MLQRHLLARCGTVTKLPQTGHQVRRLIHRRVKDTQGAPGTGLRTVFESTEKYGYISKVPTKLL